MRYSAHLPLIDIDGAGWPPGRLRDYAAAARQLGFASLGANDHLVFSRPWLDGIVALAGVIDASGPLRLATTVALPVLRGAAVLAKTAAALDLMSDGRFVLGIGPGSSSADYELAGVPFEQRWARFDEATRFLRRTLREADPVLQPAPGRLDGPPIWVASWGSPAGLRRAARLGDGWLGSAYNVTPEQATAARATLAGLRGDLTGFDCVLATMWMFITEDPLHRDEHLSRLSSMLNRPVEYLAPRVLIGSVEHCATLLTGYARAGIDEIFLWPVDDPENQLARFIEQVAPLVDVRSSEVLGGQS
jgi:alkanesulfonate monooxygenase SsuD/methylene tetrahydromethanopterin reductase-like flavin-dependent oxidoreductase (luciferase family)